MDHTAEPTTLRRNQFPQLRECTALSDAGEVKSENKQKAQWGGGNREI